MHVIHIHTPRNTHKPKVKNKTDEYLIGENKVTICFFFLKVFHRSHLKTLLFIGLVFPFKVSFCRRKDCPSGLYVLIRILKCFFSREIKHKSYFHLFILTLREIGMGKIWYTETLQYIIRTCFLLLNYAFKQNA